MDVEQNPDMAEQLPEAWDEDEDYDEEDDEDIDAEAQEIARRLGEELWADISKANAEINAVSPTVVNAEVPSSINAQLSVSTDDAISAATLGVNYLPRREESIITTMKAILYLAENDSLVRSTFTSTLIPNGTNLLDVLQHCTGSGGIPKGIAGPLSQILVTLARSDTLFGSLRHSNASAIQLDKGKRKREEFDDGQHLHAQAYKRVYVPDSDLHNQVLEAVRAISQTLGALPTQALDPSLVSSIRLPLHQVFLFAVTSSAAPSPNMHALQEISGLIQVIGVLSGIQIGQAPDPTTYSSGQPFLHNPSYPWQHGQPTFATDIGTAVYPCLVAGCHKTFSRLYSLRAHQRSHSAHRPHRCSACPASFARNHDLKRHLKLHDKKAWRCEGCHKVFSRRDAIKRHKTGPKNRGPRSGICLIAEVTEVQLDGGEGEDSLREERRAKLWNGIAVNEANGLATSVQNLHRDANIMDEGEINPAIIGGIQASVVSLHGVLRGLVGNALGTPLGRPVSAPVDPSVGQATLASVIARAQSQTVPSSKFVPLPLAQMPAGEPAATFSIVNSTTAEENSSEAQLIGENHESHQPLPSLSMYGLSDEQTHLLEIAIANAASAAQAQAEAEAALEEEEEEDYDQDDDEDDDSEMDPEQEQAPA